MEQPNGCRPEFQGTFHIAEAYENMQRTYCSVMMEDRYTGDTLSIHTFEQYFVAQSTLYAKST